MKKFFSLLALCFAMTLTAQADREVIKVKSFVDRTDCQLRVASQSHHNRGKNTLITPKGTMKYYQMNAVIRDLSGFLPVLNVANKIYENGKTYYIGSLFPGVLRCEDLWAVGQLNSAGDRIEVECADALYDLDIYDGDGNYEGAAQLHIGELLVDQNGTPYGLENAVFNKDGDHIFIEYSEGMRPIVLFRVTPDEQAEIYSTAYNHDLKIYTGNVTLNEPSSSSTVTEYIYNAQDAYGKEYSIKGHVAVDGNNYYFDSLLPEAGNAWIKGVRKGNTITLPNDQFLGSEISYYLYYNGFQTTGFDNGTGQYAGSKVEITFNIDDKGVITLNNPNRTFACAFYTSGNQFTYAFQVRMEPFHGDVAAKPSKPYDLRLITKYFEQYGENTISFLLDNVSEDGNYINPELLGYCMYLDEERYTFTSDVYPYIDGSAMTIIPFGYRDKQNYDIYLADDGRNVICFREDMFTRVGIQSVYTLNGREYGSDIAYIDTEGNTSVVTPSGVNRLNLDDINSKSFTYDLQGRKVKNEASGIFIRNNKLIIR